MPRYLQKFAAQILVGVGNSSMLKRQCYALAMKLARRYAPRRWKGAVGAEECSIGSLTRWCFGRFHKLGFDQLELVISGGAPLPRETMALWHMYGVNVVEIYGQTETAGGIIAGQRGRFRSGDVGTPPPGWKFRLSEDGEILVQSDFVFDRYWRDAEATQTVKGDDGWLRTGDVGKWVGETLRLIDRARDFIVTAGGKTISPSFVENALRASPFIAEVAVFGQGRRYLGTHRDRLRYGRRLGA